MIKIQAELDKAKEERLSLQRRYIDQEARGRRNNLLFYGIDEGANETKEQAEDKIVSFINNRLQVPGDKKSLGIKGGHRLGAPRHGSAKPRAIIVCFADFNNTKELVRSKRHSLRAPFGVSEDLPGF